MPWQHDLDRDITADRRVVGAKYGAHTAVGDLAEDAETARLLQHCLVGGQWWSVGSGAAGRRGGSEPFSDRVQSVDLLSESVDQLGAVGA